MSPPGKIVVATILLLLGVAGVGTTAETHAGWWAAGGYLCLIFVPALIFDAVVEKVRPKELPPCEDCGLARSQATPGRCPNGAGSARCLATRWAP